jgi:hypothetical protein
MGYGAGQIWARNCRMATAGKVVMMQKRPQRYTCEIIKTLCDGLAGPLDVSSRQIKKAWQAGLLAHARPPILETIITNGRASIEATAVYKRLYGSDLPPSSRPAITVSAIAGPRLGVLVSSISWPPTQSSISTDAAYPVVSGRPVRERPP